MTYTGYQEALVNGVTYAHDAAGVLDHIATTEAEYGVTFGARPLKKARGAQAKADELRAALTAHIAADAERASKIGTDYLTGKLQAPAVIVALIDSVAPDGERLSEVRRRVDVAAKMVEAGAWAELGKVTEAEWLAPMRPIVKALVDEANAAADELGITSPRRDAVGTRSAADPWAPDRLALEQNMAVRHTWERLGDILERLDRAHGVTDVLRRHGLLPHVPGRETLEDYRWLHLERLDGRPERVREFWMANRHEGEPGLFTAAEMTHVDDEAETERALAAAKTDQAGPVSVARVW